MDSSVAKHRSLMIKTRSVYLELSENRQSTLTKIPSKFNVEDIQNSWLVKHSLVSKGYESRKLIRILQLNLIWIMALLTEPSRTGDMSNESQFQLFLANGRVQAWTRPYVIIDTSYHQGTMIHLVDFFFFFTVYGLFKAKTYFGLQESLQYPVFPSSHHLMTMHHKDWWLFHKIMKCIHVVCLHTSLVGEQYNALFYDLLHSLSSCHQVCNKTQN